jgi:NitT/TauT family transport system substrate-binding protein
VLKPKDLEGRSVAHSVGETGTSYLNVFCAVNAVDCGKVKKVQMDAQSRVPQFLQGQVDVVSVYVNNDLPLLESRVGTKFPTLSLAQYGLAIPGLSVVTSTATLAKKPDVLKRYLAAVDKALEATRKDPKAAAAALGKAWQGSPAQEIVEAQVRATMDSIPTASAGKPAGWMEPAQMAQSLELIKSDEGVGAVKPAETFYTNELLPR